MLTSEVCNAIARTTWLAICFGMNTIFNVSNTTFLISGRFLIIVSAALCVWLWVVSCRCGILWVSKGVIYKIHDDRRSFFTYEYEQLTPELDGVKTPRPRLIQLVPPSYFVVEKIAQQRIKRLRLLETCRIASTILKQLEDV